MRKLLIVGVVLVVALSAFVGAIFAQETDEPAQAWLGVRITDEDDQVVITRVQSGSPASEAELLAGDIITSFNGEAVASAVELTEMVAAAAPGDVVTLEIQRGEGSQDVEVTLGTKPERGERPERDLSLPEDALSAVELLVNADLQDADDGFDVVNVFAGRNPFDLVEGDVITTLNDQAVADLDTAALTTELQAGEATELTLVVVRDGEAVTLTQTLGGGLRGGHRGGHEGGGRRGLGDGQQPPADNPADQNAPVLPSGGNL